MTVRIMVGHVINKLQELPAESVHCVWTSIPYYGLRSYNTEPQVWGSEGCAHEWGELIGRKAKGNPNGGLAFTGTGSPETRIPGLTATVDRGNDGAFCRQCGAWRGEHGLEPTLDLWLANEVTIWREVRRVLRKDGVAWLNCGDAYATSSNGRSAADTKAAGDDDRTFRDKPFSTARVANLANVFDRRIEGGVPILVGSHALRFAPKGSHVLTDDKPSPNNKLVALLRAKRVLVKQRNQHLREVINLLDAPVCYLLCPSMWEVKTHAADVEILVNEADDISVVASQLDLGADAALRIATGTVGPGAEVLRCTEAAWDAFAGNFASKGLLKINSVDHPVALRNGVATLAGGRRHFRVAHAGGEHLTLASVDGRIEVAIRSVGHAFFRNRFGSLVSVGELYHDLEIDRRRYRSKQRLMLPDRLMSALIDDGWYVRDECIWGKPNPMPSSVKDRTTPAHEMLYLLTRSARYYFDAAAIMEPMAESSVRRLSQPSIDTQMGGEKQDQYDALGLNAKSGSRRPNEIVKGLARKSFHGSAKFAEAGDALAPASQRQNGGKNEAADFPNGSARTRAGFNERWDASEAHRRLNDQSEKLVAGEKWGARHEGWKATAAERVGRNKRSVWTIPTEPYPGAHFATAPTALVEPCIKAGSSERGCCPKCGAPWRRIHSPTGHVNNREPAHQPGNSPTKTDSTGWAPTSIPTAEWESSCRCAAGDPVPCTVLDLFLGSGTTAMVADRLGRHAIGVELNPKYAADARLRIEGDSPLFTVVAAE